MLKVQIHFNFDEKFLLIIFQATDFFFNRILKRCRYLKICTHNFEYLF